MSLWEYMEFARNLIHTGHFKPQNEFLFRRGSAKPLVDIILRYENIGKWERILKHRLQVSVDLEHCNWTPKAEILGEVGVYQKRKILAEICRMYETDFELLGYSL